MSRVNSLFWSYYLGTPEKTHGENRKKERLSRVFSGARLLGGSNFMQNAMVNFTRFPLSKSVLFRFIFHIITRSSTSTTSRPHRDQTCTDGTVARACRPTQGLRCCLKFSASSRWPQPCQPQHQVASSKRPHKQGHERYKGLDRIRKGNRVNISAQHRQHQHANAHTAKDHLRVMLRRCGFSGSCANSFLRDSFKWSPHWWLIDLLAPWFRI